MNELRKVLRNMTVANNASQIHDLPFLLLCHAHYVGSWSLYLSHYRPMVAVTASGVRPALRWLKLGGIFSKHLFCNQKAIFL